MSYFDMNSHATWLIAFLFYCHYLQSSVAFLSTSKLPSTRVSIAEIFLFVENDIGDHAGGIMNGIEKYSKEVIESSKQNKNVHTAKIQGLRVPEVSEALQAR